MRLNRKEHLLLFDEPLSIAEEAAYHSTIESFQENHAYSCLRRAPSYPNKPTVTALQLSRTPSLMSLVSAQSPRCSTPSSFRYGKYTPSVTSIPSLAHSTTSNSRSTESSSTPQSSSGRKFSRSPLITAPGSPGSLVKIIESIDYKAINTDELTAFRIQAGDEKQQPQRSHRPPRPITRPLPRKRVLPNESVVKSGKKLNELVTRPMSLPLMNETWSARETKTLSRIPEDTMAIARSLAGRSTLLAGKTVACRMSIFERIANLEAGLKPTDPDVFDFELPGFDPCMDRVLVGGYK